MSVPYSSRNLVSSTLTALRKGDAEAIQQLLENGMNPNIKLTGSARALTSAVLFSDPHIFDTYIRYGANINMPQVGINNPLFFAASKGDVQGVVRALAAGADVQATRNRGSRQRQKVTHVAINSAMPQITRLLLDAGGWRDLNPPREPNEPALGARLNKDKPEHRETLELMQRYARLPRLDFKSNNFDKSALFAKDDSGDCPLDHPETWEKWDVVCAVLAQKGESLSKDELLQTDENGKSWMQQAIRSRALGKVLHQLVEQGEPLSHKDLLLPNGGQGALLEMVREHRQQPYLMRAENCAHWSKDGLRQVMRHMGEYETTMFVPNRHALFAELDTKEHLAAVGGRGR